MPDIWTHHPQKLRRILEEGKFSCGIEPRIFRGKRDPQWTCGIDTPDWFADVYIHPASQLWRSNEGTIVIVLAFVIGAAMGHIAGRRGASNNKER